VPTGYKLCKVFCEISDTAAEVENSPSRQDIEAFEEAGIEDSMMAGVYSIESPIPIYA